MEVWGGGISGARVKTQSPAGFARWRNSRWLRPALVGNPSSLPARYERRGGWVRGGVAGCKFRSQVFHSLLQPGCLLGVFSTVCVGHSLKQLCLQLAGRPCLPWGKRGCKVANLQNVSTENCPILERALLPRAQGGCTEAKARYNER